VVDMNQESRGARGPSPIPEDDPTTLGHETTGMFATLKSRQLIDAEIDRGGIDSFPELWLPEDKAWIRDASERRLRDRRVTFLEVRRTVRRVAVERDAVRLADELGRAGEHVSPETLTAEIEHLGARLRKLRKTPWERLAGVATLRWVADGKEQAGRAVELMAVALRKVRNTLDKSHADTWARVLDASPFKERRIDRARLLWHIHEPSLDDLERAHPYFRACVESAAYQARQRIKDGRCSHDQHQQRAKDTWDWLCATMEDGVPPASPIERDLFGWADRHLATLAHPTPFKERTLFQRLFYATRPDAAARAELRRILEQGCPSLIQASRDADEAAREAERARDDWHLALDDYQKALEDIPGFFDLRDTFLQSLADAHARSAKG
jgi:hypothetical protein